MTSEKTDPVETVTQALFASDNDALAADGIEPNGWSDLGPDQQASYRKTAAGLIDSGFIAWPPRTLPALLEPAAVEALARVIHEDIDQQWPKWPDLYEHSRVANRQYVWHLDAAGLLNHEALGVAPEPLQESAADRQTVELTEEES